MVYNKYEDLMNRSIDGLLSPEEQVEFEEYLRNNPDAGKQFEKLRRAAQILKQTPPAAPPLEIKQEIMAFVKSSPKASPKQPGIFEQILYSLRSRTAWRYGYAFSLGLVCGIVILAVSNDKSERSSAIDSLQVSGALISQPFSDTESLESKTFSVGTVEGVIETRAFENIVILDLDILSGNAVDIKISFDSDDLSYAGFWHPVSFRGGFDIVDNHLTLSQQGVGKHSLLFVDNLPVKSNLVFEIKSGDYTLREELSAFATEN